jgi:hypothetical protein
VQGEYYDDAEYEPSSGNSNDDEPVDFADVQNMTLPEAGEHIYLGYRTAKRKFRKFTGQKGRTSKGRFTKGHGKGNKSGGKSKGKPTFWTADGVALYADDGNGFSTSDAWTSSAYPAVQKGSKGTGKRRGNPIGPDGQIMKCTLCKSEEHFQRFCPQNPNAGKGGKGKSGFVASSSPAVHWSQQFDAMPGGPVPTGQYFGAAVSQPEFTASIRYSDGSSEQLESTTALLASFSAASNFPSLSPTSTTAQPIPQHLQKLWQFPWWTTAFHTTVRLQSGKEGLLIDCGAVDDMAGNLWRGRVEVIGNSAGQGTSRAAISPISVEGVGDTASVASVRAKLPICLANGQQSSYKPIVVGTADKPSELPALYGLVGLRGQAAIIDCGNNRLIVPGPGGIQYTLSPGTQVHKLEVAQSGHLLLPCCEWQAAKPGQADSQSALR